MSLAAAWALIKGLAASWQYVVIAAALAWAGIAQIGWSNCKAGRLGDQAEAQAAVIAFQEADAAKTRAIEDAHAAEVARLKGEANDREDAIRRSAASRVCLDSGAARAFLGSLPARPSGAGAPPGAGRAGQAVSR